MKLKIKRYFKLEDANKAVLYFRARNFDSAYWDIDVINGNVRYVLMADEKDAYGIRGFIRGFYEGKEVGEEETREKLLPQIKVEVE